MPKDLRPTHNTGGLTEELWANRLSGWMTGTSGGQEACVVLEIGSIRLPPHRRLRMPDDYPLRSGFMTTIFRCTRSSASKQVGLSRASAPRGTRPESTADRRWL